jgi:hypothetical protein
MMAERWARMGATLPRFFLGVAAGLTAIGIARLVTWLREPVTGTRTPR